MSSTVVEIWESLPMDVRQQLWDMQQDRARCRVVTRNKQRRNW